MTTEKDIEDCAARALRFENLAGELAEALEGLLDSLPVQLSGAVTEHEREIYRRYLAGRAVIKKAEDMKNETE